MWVGGGCLLNLLDFRDGRRYFQSFAFQQKGLPTRWYVLFSERKPLHDDALNPDTEAA